MCGAKARTDIYSSARTYSSAPVLITLDNPHSPITAPEQWNDYFVEQMTKAFTRILGVDEEAKDLSEEQKVTGLTIASGLLSIIIPLIDMLEIDNLSGADFILNVVSNLKADGYV